MFQKPNPHACSLAAAALLTLAACGGGDIMLDLEDELLPTPTAEPTTQPSAAPTTQPSAEPTTKPSVEPTATSTPAPTAANTPVPTATNTPVPTATNTPVPTATNTPVPTATNTPVPTATNTPVPTATNTPVPTNTNTPLPTATNTPAPTATNTPLPTATNTPLPTVTNTPVPTATNTPEPQRTIAGQVAPGLVAQQVCLDSNQNLQCDADEPSTAAAANGAFSLTVPADSSAWLLATAANAPYAAPLDDAPTISALSTLQVARMAAGQSQEAAATALESKLQLQAVSWADYSRNSSHQAEWQRVEAGAQAALAQGYAEAATQGQSAGSALPLLATALENALARYIPANSNALLASIGPRTLGSETALALNNTICPAATAVPTVWIDIEGGQTIVEKTDEYAADLYFEGAEAHKDGKVFAIEKIKGRGNMTWTLPKKPYKLKLDKKLNVLDMPSKNKHWILVANYLDQTLLKNDTAFCMSRQLALDWTPSSRPVEFYLNGSFQGAYSMIEHIRDDAERVNIGSRIGSVKAPHPDDGFFVEMDWRLDEEFFFYTPIGHAYTVKTDSSAAERDMIAQYMADFENRLYDREHPNYIANLAESLDIEAFIDYYLINELMLNFDGYALSTFAYRPTGGKLTFGPVWDFDLSAGSTQTAETQKLESWLLANKKPTFAPSGTNSYMAELLEHPEMRAHTLARMKYLRTQVPQILSFIQQSQLLLDPARQRDIALWDNADNKTYAQRVQDLENWIDLRSAWMLNQMEAGNFR